MAEGLEAHELDDGQPPIDLRTIAQSLAELGLRMDRQEERLRGRVPADGNQGILDAINGLTARIDRQDGIIQEQLRRVQGQPPLLNQPPPGVPPPQNGRPADHHAPRDGGAVPPGAQNGAAPGFVPPQGDRDIPPGNHDRPRHQAPPGPQGNGMDPPADNPGLSMGTHSCNLRVNRMDLQSRRHHANLFAKTVDKFDDMKMEWSLHVTRFLGMLRSNPVPDDEAKRALAYNMVPNPSQRAVGAYHPDEHCSHLTLGEYIEALSQEFDPSTNAKYGA